MHVPLPLTSYSIPLFSISIPTPYPPTSSVLPLSSHSLPSHFLCSPSPYVLPASEYLDRIKTQVMDWFRNIEKQPLEIVEAADGTLITSHPEDMFNVIHVQVTPHTDTWHKYKHVHTYAQAHTYAYTHTKTYTHAPKHVMAGCRMCFITNMSCLSISLLLLTFLPPHV